jgi:hypothetical protein
MGGSSCLALAEATLTAIVLCVVGNNSLAYKDPTPKATLQDTVPIQARARTGQLNGKAPSGTAAESISKSPARHMDPVSISFLPTLFSTL